MHNLTTINNVLQTGTPVLDNTILQPITYIIMIIVIQANTTILFNGLDYNLDMHIMAEVEG